MKISLKQQKKLDAIKKRKTRSRVSKFRNIKKEENYKLIQFYLDEDTKLILDNYKKENNLTTSEVLKKMILKLKKIKSC